MVFKSGLEEEGEGTWWGRDGAGGGVFGGRVTAGRSLLVYFIFPFWPVSSFPSLPPPRCFCSARLGSALPRRGGGQDLGQEGHAIHWPHGDVERARHIHRHGGCDGHGVGDIHGRRGGDVDRGDVDGPGDGHRVLQAHRGSDVDRVGANVHLRRDGHWVVVDAPVHRRSDGSGHAHGRGRGRVAHVVAL